MDRLTEVGETGLVTVCAEQMTEIRGGSAGWLTKFISLILKHHRRFLEGFMDGWYDNEYDLSY